MRVLYHSAVPWAPSGYARVTREVAPRLQNEGHDVAIQCLAAIKEAPITWHGDELYYRLDEPMKVYPSEPGATDQHFGLTQVKKNYEDFDADLYFTHFDTWMQKGREVIPNLDIPYMSYVIVDHYPTPDAVVEQVLNAHNVISMSKFAKQALEERGVYSHYIPHGINPHNYYPYDEEYRQEMKIESVNNEGDIRQIPVSDNFIVGMVGANYGDRKNIPNQFLAFKRFLDTVDEDAVLYIHTQMNSPQGFQLTEIRDKIGIPDENIIFTSNKDYGDVGDDFLNALYNSFDVLLNCSYGESWGLTVTEAQAAGTPCIATNFSSMPEQLGADPTKKDWEQPLKSTERNNTRPYVIAPHGILVNPSIPIWREKVSSKQYVAHPNSIYKALKHYYESPDLRREHGEKAKDYVRDNYTWEHDVVPAFLDAFDDVEDLLI